MCKLGTLVLEGESGNKYDFNVYNWGANLSDIGAVYYISNRYKDSDGDWTHQRIYIGQTSDLSERFDDHHKAQCFEDHDANAISIHQEANESTRLTIEEDLIDALNPTCNGYPLSV